MIYNVPSFNPKRSAYQVLVIGCGCKNYKPNTFIDIVNSEQNVIYFLLHFLMVSKIIIIFLIFKKMLKLRFQPIKSKKLNPCIFHIYREKNNNPYIQQSFFFLTKSIIQCIKMKPLCFGGLVLLLSSGDKTYSVGPTRRK